VTEAVIVETARTPIGRAHKGSLVGWRPDDLGGFIVGALLAKVPAVRPADVEDVVFGAAVHVAEQGRNLARVVSLLAGLPETVPGTTVNRFCSSSLQAARIAYHAIKAGEGDVFVAGGVESVTRTAGKEFSPDLANPRFTDESLPDFVNHIYIPMGLTAENVATAYGVSRRRMDELAKVSQDRAVAAQDSGFFGAEITPVPLPDGGLMTRDDGPRRGTTVERLAELPPVFLPEGSVTAGNSCPLNDGAAAVLIMSDGKARAAGVQPLARIVATAVSGVAPELMGIGPIPAVRAVLDRAGLKIGDIDIVELNEAFAAQVLPVCDELGISIEDQLNPHGGAIALGHPFGMTGARMLTTLVHELQHLDKTLGIATMCVGGGQGMAMVVERLR
jgi:acetyl-CoA C-acetyltransferase